jgi:hypothetical protein
VYRVGGGPASLPLGSFFSPLKVDCVSEAELRFNIVDWGNRCYYLATYRVRAGAEMWVGKVAHAPADIANRSALQIYIDNPAGKVDLVRDIQPLKQDLFVSPRAGNA